METRFRSTSQKDLFKDGGQGSLSWMPTVIGVMGLPEGPSGNEGRGCSLRGSLLRGDDAWNGPTKSPSEKQVLSLHLAKASPRITVSDPGRAPPGGHGGTQAWRRDLQHRCVYRGPPNLLPPRPRGAQPGPASAPHIRSEGLSGIPSATAVSSEPPSGSSTSSEAPGRAASRSGPMGRGVQAGVQGVPGVGRGGNQENPGAGASATSWGSTGPEAAAWGMRKKM